MPNDTRQIVNKAWSFAHLLRDDGSKATHPGAARDVSPPGANAS